MEGLQSSLEMDTRIDDTRGGSRLTTKAKHVQRPLVFATHSKQLAIQVFLVYFTVQSSCL